MTELLEEGWEIAGRTAHRSLHAAMATATWMRSQKRMAGWDYTAATLADGTHRVLRRRTDGRPPRSASPGADARPAPTHHLARLLRRSRR